MKEDIRCITTGAAACDLATRIERMPGGLKVMQLITLLGASRSYVYGLIESGRIPYYRLPTGAIRLDPVKVAQWLRSCEIALEEAA